MALDHDNAAPDDTTPRNEQFEEEQKVKQTLNNHKDGDDASAHRNVGAHGYTQRSDQKDQLDNLHIGGSETTPQGGNDHHTEGEQAQGPGFTKEGSYEMGNGVRSRDQDFGEAAPSGPAKPAQD